MKMNALPFLPRKVAAPLRWSTKAAYGLLYFALTPPYKKVRPHTKHASGSRLKFCRRFAGTGRYETAQSALITTSEQYEIRKTIKSRAKNSSVHYQTVYNALYDYFKIASYKDLRHDQMKAALTLIETCTLKPQLPAPTLAEGSVILSAQEAEALLTFIYYVRFLFADVFGKLDGLLRIVDSPLAGSFWDAFHEVSWGRILEILAKHGHDINDMPCYQHWSSCQPKRKAA